MVVDINVAKRLSMNLHFKQLSHWQQQVFAASLTQRMLPNYALFSDNCGFGDYSLLQNQMDLIWQKLSLMPVKINVEAQLLKLEPHIPQAADFDQFVVYPAIDLCSAMVCLFESFEDESCNVAVEVSRLSVNSVSAYLDFLQLAGENPEAQVVLADDPLWQWESQTQQQLLQMVNDGNRSAVTCRELRQWVQSQAMTNLGVAY